MTLFNCITIPLNKKMLPEIKTVDVVLYIANDKFIFEEKIKDIPFINKDIWSDTEKDPKDQKEREKQLKIAKEISMKYYNQFGEKIIDKLNKLNCKSDLKVSIEKKLKNVTVLPLKSKVIIPEFDFKTYKNILNANLAFKIISIGEEIKKACEEKDMKCKANYINKNKLYVKYKEYEEQLKEVPKLVYDKVKEDVLKKSKADLIIIIKVDNFKLNNGEAIEYGILGIHGTVEGYPNPNSQKLNKFKVSSREKNPYSEKNLVYFNYFGNWIYIEGDKDIIKSYNLIMEGAGEDFPKYLNETK